MRVLVATSVFLTLMLCSAGEKFIARIATIEVNETEYSFALPRSGPAVNLAVSKANEQYKDSIEFRVIFRNNTCNAFKIGAEAAGAYYEDDITVFIGPACSDAVEVLGYMAADWNLPLITPAGNTKALRNVTQYPTVTKLSPFGLEQFAEFAEAILKRYQWRHIALIYDHSNREGVASRMGRSFQQYFRTSTFDITHLPLRARQLNAEGYKAALETGSENARVFILHASADVVRDVLMVAHGLGYTSGEYAFIVTVSLRDSIGSEVWQTGDDNDQEALQAFQCVFFLALRESTAQRYETFRDNVINNALDNWGLDFGDDDPGDFVSGYHDAVTIYAKVLHEMLEEGEDPRDGRAMSRRIWNRTFKGIEGNVTIDEIGSRDADLSLLDVTTDGRVLAVGRFRGRTKIYTKVPGREIVWPSQSGAPPDVPECGFKGLRCTYNVTEMKLMGGLISSLCVAVILMVIFYCKVCRHTGKTKSYVDKWWWKIDSEDIMVGGKFNGGSMSSFNSKISSLTPKSDSIPSYCGDMGMFKACPVRLKKLELKTVVVEDALLEEFLHIRDLNFENLARLYGASLDDEEKYLVTEFCQKGSLQDIIGNSDVNLDAQFKFSLCLDVVKGMTYLHDSPLKKHGRLTSAVCLVDNCFSVKITDYGPQRLLNQVKVDYRSQEFKKVCLWQAPELLRCRDLRGSKEGDVYSFGIILQEIFSRDSPYSSQIEEIGIEAVISKIKKGGHEPLRPQFEATTSLLCIKELMSRCWAEDPKLRPDFASVKRELKDIAARFGASGNFFDNLLLRMEQYANNLEKLVDEKTHRVREEKKRSEELLHQIIPKSVANQLKQGKRVKPDTFESVTVCFTDICGFTHLAARSTPMQVVDLLNDLYSCFDDIIDGYDVYKVETIGDAYLVVSGLPVRNGDRHAPEISRMSLTLLRAIDTIRISHLPNDRLRLRVGVHSGPVCAGVVGQKMPRYCLFGETVITASRMESSGDASKIHISGAVKTILDRCGVFVIGSRGNVMVKGIGQMNTYWLLGEKIWNR